MFTSKKSTSLRNQNNSSTAKSTNAPRRNNAKKQQILNNGIEYYDDIASVVSLSKGRNEDFLPLFMQKVLNELPEKEIRENESIVMAMLLSKVVKKGESFNSAQDKLLSWIETMLEWCFALLETDPRDETYSKLAFRRVKASQFQHMWTVAMLALLRLLSCRENHYAHDPKKNISLLVRRCIALISNVFLLEEDNIFKPHIDNSTDETGKTIYPLSVQAFLKSLPMMQIFTMKLAGALMLTFRDSLMPYVSILHDLSEQLLKTFHIQQANESIELGTFQRYREAIRMVSIFVESYGNYSFDLITRSLVPILSKNVVPFHRALQLWNSNYMEEKKKLLESMSAKNKRRKRKDAQEMEDALKESPLQTSCIEASVLLRSTFITVELLASIFCHCKQQITRHNQIEAYTNISDLATRCIHVLTLWHEQVHLSTRVLHKHVPEIERTCPVAVSFYRLLKGILQSVNASESSSPFMNQSLRLFREGKKQTLSRDMVNLCHDALLVMEAFTHPRAKPLFIPHAESIEILYESMRETVKRNEVSNVLDKFDEQESNQASVSEKAVSQEKTTLPQQQEPESFSIGAPLAVKSSAKTSKDEAQVEEKQGEATPKKANISDEVASKKRKQSPSDVDATAATTAPPKKKQKTVELPSTTEASDDNSSVDVDMEEGPDQGDEDLSDMEFDM